MPPKSGWWPWPRAGNATCSSGAHCCRWICAPVACTIQNLWLAARAEGLGMGCVSMFDPQAVAALLGMPEGAEPVALLCIGPVHRLYDQPMLEQAPLGRPGCSGQSAF